MSSIQNATQMFGIHNAKGQEIHLVMQELSLAGHILPVGARIIVRHVFQSAETTPVEAIYGFGLPRDAALRRFRIEGEGFSVHSELHEVEKAVKLYENGIQEGRLSALAQQYGDGLVNLSIGNLRPKEEVSVFLEVIAGVETRDDGYRFRFPFSLAPNYHRDARATEAEPGMGEIELPEDRFGDLLLPRFKKNGEDLHQIGFEITLQQPDPQGEVSSPSHTLRVRPEGQDVVRVSLARESDVPNRDLVLDVKHDTKEPMVFSGLDAQSQGQIAALIPSTCFGNPAEDPTRVVLVLDRSGSMSGVPIQQAKKAVEACLAALSPSDMFGIVVFDNDADRFMPGLVPADQANRKSACEFLKKHPARGGTELEQALRSAGSLFEKSGGNLLLLTDGQVFETETILRTVREMGHRLHVLGIGSASQDRFLSLLARETGGVSRFLTPRERVDLGALELFSSIGNPAAEELTLGSSGAQQVTLAPEPAKSVFAGSPVNLWGETRGNGKGKLELTWKGHQPGSLIVDYEVPDTSEPLAETLRLLRGARLLTDLDSKLVSSTGAEGRRQTKRIEERMQRLSKDFQLASRQMALVAVVQREGDHAGTLPKTHVVPVGMPEDVAFDSLFLDSEGASMDFCMATRSSGASTLHMLGEVSDGFASELSAPTFSRVKRFLSSKLQQLEQPEQEPEVEETSQLIELAILIQPDGGMPGDSLTARVQRSLLAILCFCSEEDIRRRGIFKAHVVRLIGFIKAVDRDQLSAALQGLCDRSLMLVGQEDFEWEAWEETAKKLTGEKQLKETDLERLLSSVVAESPSPSKS